MNFPDEPNKGATYSQWGEDRLVLDFFKNAQRGVFFEAGAHHPTILSQTYLLELNGWSGVLVEPSTDFVCEFAKLRPRSQLFHYALGSPAEAGKQLAFIIPKGLDAEARILEPNEKCNSEDRQFTVDLITIDQVLEKSGVVQLDYFSLDLEGYELNALCGINFKRWRPKLILIEDHLHTLCVHRYLSQQDYRLVYRRGSNSWYVPAATPFPMGTLKIKLELFRKLYLSMPFRKLRVELKKMQGKRP
jgi:FkbM family methyltransferase